MPLRIASSAEERKAPKKAAPLHDSFAANKRCGEASCELPAAASVAGSGSGGGGGGTPAAPASKERATSVEALEVRIEEVGAGAASAPAMELGSA